MSMRLHPCDCECMADLLAMDSTHTSVGRFNMMIQHDQAVIFTEQRRGEKPQASIVIPKRVFLQMLDWYQGEIC